MDTTTIHAFITGRVQGVFFRDYTRRKATELNLSGWVKNCPDGSVETLFSGKTPEVAEMLEWLWTGSPNAIVKNVKAEETSLPETAESFLILY